MTAIVCPYCVQYRCTTHPDTPLDEFDECNPSFGCEFEPYWPDGSVAVLTQDDPCDRCAETLTLYYAEQNGSDRA